MINNNTVNSRLENFIRNVPKAELHIHLEGAFRWETIKEVHPKRTKLPKSPPWLKKKCFSDFDEFQKIFQNYIRPATGTKELIERHTYEVLSDLADQQVKYVEFTSGPAFHTLNGLEVEDVLLGILKSVDRAEDDFGIISKIHIGLNRHGAPKVFVNDMHRLIKLKDSAGRRIVCGIDLQGDEKNPIAKEYVEAIEFAVEAGLRIKAHAGEFCGPESVREVLELLKVKHIQHGVRAIEDRELVKELSTKRIFLHQCLSSNVWLGAVSSIEKHPLPAFLNANCRVTLNSDDPILFNCTILSEFLTAATAFNFTANEIAKLCKTAFDASMLEDDKKQNYIKEIEKLTP